MPQISHFHKYRNCFQVFLQLFRPTAINPYKFYGRDMSGYTLFHFCQLPPVKKAVNLFVEWWLSVAGLQQLYNIGWHWGLYENMLHTSWWYSPRQYGKVNIIMTSAVYSHTTRNKAIQYYYYYIIWSWLYSEILTILMYIVYVGLHWCKLTSLTTVINISSI